MRRRCFWFKPLPLDLWRGEWRRRICRNDSLPKKFRRMARPPESKTQVRHIENISL